MVRVIYRWKVESENFEDFQKAWSEATNRIHKSVAGAKGSFMLRSYENETDVRTIAKWDSVKSWKRFWGNKNPKDMETMRKLGKRISVEIFNEIQDFTR